MGQPSLEAGPSPMAICKIPTSLQCRMEALCREAEMTKSAFMRLAIEELVIWLEANRDGGPLVPYGPTGAGQ